MVRYGIIPAVFLINIILYGGHMIIVRCIRLYQYGTVHCELLSQYKLKMMENRGGMIYSTFHACAKPSL